jgi:hypothetical protein
MLAHDIQASADLHGQLNRPALPWTLAPPEFNLSTTQEKHRQLLDELCYLRMKNIYLKKLNALIQANEPSARESKR